jgi:hypothetical protein
MASILFPPRRGSTVFVGDRSTCQPLWTRLDERFRKIDAFGIRVIRPQTLAEDKDSHGAHHIRS